MFELSVEDETGRRCNQGNNSGESPGVQEKIRDGDNTTYFDKK